MTRTLHAIAVLLTAASLSAQTTRTLPADTRFFVPTPAQGSTQQIEKLAKHGHLKDALLVAAMEAGSQAVWLTGGTPSEINGTVVTVMRQATLQRAVPFFVLYNIPGRDCGSYSAGGAQDTPTYETWISAIATAIGDQKAVLVVEPDALANLPSDCGYPSTVNSAQLTANRYTQINYAVTTLEAKPQTLVYLDAGNSAWHAVGDMATRLVAGGIFNAQGFFSNVSNFRLSDYETHFDTWISQCLAFGTNPADGGWRLGNYDYCASQYYSPDGSVDPNNIATWTYSDQWYTANLGTAVPTTHFIVDTSRNGQGPINMSVYAAPPYNQPASVIQTLNNGSYCNPPGRGLGTPSTASTSVPLLDAYLWIKTPGQSDGACDAAGGARAWDYAAYTLRGWPTDPNAQSLFDPLWALDDPAAGAWFPQEALTLAKQANPPLLKF